MVGGRHEEVAPVRQAESVGACRRAEAGPLTRCGALQGHDGRRLVPFHQPQEITSGSAALCALRPATLAGPCDSELERIWPGPAAL